MAATSNRRHLPISLMLPFDQLRRRIDRFTADPIASPALSALFGQRILSSMPCAAMCRRRRLLH